MIPLDNVTPEPGMNRGPTPAHHTTQHAPMRPAGFNPFALLQRVRFLARRFWWIAALAIMAALIYTTYKIHQQVPHYYSTSRMILNGRLSIPEGNVYSDEVDNFFGTQVSLMRSPMTVNRAIERVTYSHPDVQADHSAQVDVDIEPRTSIFTLRVSSTNGDYAKLLLDAVMDTYLDDKRGRKNLTTDEALSAITDKLTDVDATIHKDEQSLLDFQKQNDVVFIEEQSSDLAGRIVTLNNDLAHLLKQEDLLAMEEKDPILSAQQKEADMRATMPMEPAATPATNAPASVVPPSDNPLANPPSMTADNDPLAAQESRIEQLKIEYAKLRVNLKPEHPKMVDLQDQINQQEAYLTLVKQHSQSSLAQREEEMQLQIANLRKEIAAATADSLHLSPILATYHQLKDKLSREQSLYNQLSESIQNVGVNKSIDQADVGILESASPSQVILPENLMKLVYAAMQGLGAGIAIIFLVSKLDDRINSPLQLEKHFDHPLIGHIPRVDVDAKTGRAPLLNMEDTRYEFLEFFRNLRSSVLFHLGEMHLPKQPNAARSLMVTSAAPNEGKSSIAANLAICLAHSEYRVLLVDADLRRGVVHELFGKALSPGLADYLQHELELSTLIQKTHEDRLNILSRGKIQIKNSDLLSPSAVRGLLKEVESNFDFIIFDSPPLLAANDAVALASEIDATIFVARVHLTSVRSMRTAMADLLTRKARVLGLVINAVDRSLPGYFEKYRYKEYYAHQEPPLVKASSLAAVASAPSGSEDKPTENPKS